MASENVESWIRKYAKLARGPVLEIGARRFGEYIDVRSLFPDVRDFVGCDLEPGENVDIVLDISAPFADVNKRLGGRRFATIFCTSVLEHIADVFSACSNISKLLDRGGVLFLSVPFVFRFHAYPNDYWRFTPEAVRVLFPKLNFEMHRRAGVMSTLTPGEVKSIPSSYRKRNRLIFRPRSRTGRAIRKLLKKWRPDLVRGNYSLAPTMINMIGVKGRMGPPGGSPGQKF